MNTRRIIISLACLTVCLTLSWKAPAWAKDFKVLILNGAANGMNSEAPALESFTKVEGNTFTFDQVGINWQGNTHPVPDSVVIGDAVEKGEVDFMQYDIIWFTWNAIGHDREYFIDDAETLIRHFVKMGGIVWASAMDHTNTPEGKWRGGWLPIERYPIDVRDSSDINVNITEDGNKTGIFTWPHKVDPNALVTDDHWVPRNRLRRRGSLDRVLP